MPESTPPSLLFHAFGRTDAAAPTLVLLHGVTDSGLCWGDAVRRWGPGYRIAAIDALGHGGSPRVTPAQLAGRPGEHMYAAALATIEELAARHGPVLLLGHSMGGATAGAITARRPDLVRAAVLEDPAWITPGVESDPVAAGAAFLASRAPFVDDLGAALATGRTEHPGWPACEMEPWARAKVEADPALLAAGAILVSDPWPVLVARIARPVLVVTGTEGTIIGRSRPAIEAIGNPLLEIRVIAGAGHCVRRDRGDAFHALVDPWLDRHAAEGRAG